MNKKIKVFLFSTFKTSFIEDDFHYIKKNYISKWISDSGINAIFHIISNCFNYQVYIVWFASTYSALIVFLSKIFKFKPLYVMFHYLYEIIAFFLYLKNKINLVSDITPLVMVES